MSSFDRTYRNPVTGIPSADPFVLKHAGEYWAYVTGEWQDGRCFGILHSKDLVNWEARAGALAPLQPPAGEQYTCYWAPEVSYDNGIFYLYYSVGDEEHMHIRAATSTEPDGPFIDSGHRLTSEQFAIDAHVFTDADGDRYLFYAADFLDHTHIGTGIVADRMLDAFHLAGSPQPVARARFDWQVYDPNRAEKGGVRWHTVEGPFVLKRKGRYYLMFSGGNWQNDSYGLAYAVSDRMDFSKEWEQPCDGDCTRPILKSNQAQGVIGPGHNSVVRGPDNRQLYCVYHRWNQEVGARVMAIDRLEWVGERLAVLGPSTGDEVIAQPPLPASGSFKRKQVLALPQSARALAAELTLRAAEPSAVLGLHLRTGKTDILALRIHPAEMKITVHTPDGEWTSPLPKAFRLDVDHLLRVEINAQLVSLHLNDALFAWTGLIQSSPTEMALISETGGEYRGFSITPGWEDTFQHEISLQELGWKVDSGGGWKINAGALQQADAGAQPAQLMKNLPFETEAYEVVVNARIHARKGEGFDEGWITFHPAATAAANGPSFSIRRSANGWELHAAGNADEQTVRLPHDFDPHRYQQFRFRVDRRAIQAYLEQIFLLSVAFDGNPGRAGLSTNACSAEFDLFRVTQFKEE
jgi:GH43 family beta-xylosidase